MLTFVTTSRLVTFARNLTISGVGGDRRPIAVLCIDSAVAAVVVVDVVFDIVISGSSCSCGRICASNNVKFVHFVHKNE